MVKFDFSIIQWHSNTKVIIQCGSSKHLFFCCVCYFQWPSKNSPLHGFIACWSCQTTFISENIVLSITSKWIKISQKYVNLTHRKNSSKSSFTISPSSKETFAPSPASSAWFKIRSKFVSSSALKMMTYNSWLI